MTTSASSMNDFTFLQSIYTAMLEKALNGGDREDGIGPNLVLVQHVGITCSAHNVFGTGQCMLNARA